MRLIDAEKLLAEVDCSIELVSVDETMYIPYVDYVDEICNAPTVEAIPVEWIENGIRADLNFALNDPREGTTEVRDGIVHCISGALAAQVLMNTIALWRKENERRDHNS